MTEHVTAVDRCTGDGADTEQSMWEPLTSKCTGMMVDLEVLSGYHSELTGCLDLRVKV